MSRKNRNYLSGSTLRYERMNFQFQFLLFIFMKDYMNGTTSKFEVEVQMPKSNEFKRSRPVAMLKVNIIVTLSMMEAIFSLRCTRRIQLSAISKSGKLF